METFSLELLNQSFARSIPLALLLVTGLVLMLLDAFRQRGALPWVAGAGLLLSAAAALLDRVAGEMVVFNGMIDTGGFSSVLHVLLCLSGVFLLFFLRDYLDRYQKAISDVYALVVFAVLGMVLFANARDLLITFIGLETMSMCFYIFAALYKTDPKSNESGLKYFLLGSFASAFMLFGIAMLYGASGYTYTDEADKLISVAGSTQFDQIALNLQAIAELSSQDISFALDTDSRNLIIMLGIGLLLVGFLFKVAAFPFHAWTPDVYEGAPTPLAGFMATGGKLAAFAALGMVAMKLGFLASEKITILLAVIAVLTMVYGNITAARQSNIKRLLAYSGIAHSGYVLLGLAAGTMGFAAVIFYMVIYTFMNLGAFALVGMVERDYVDTNLESWRGLGQRAPWFAGAMTIFLLSLAGIPPLAGFMAKYVVFAAAIRADLILPAVIGILSSVVGAYYYLRIIVMMFFSPSETSSLNLRFGYAPVVGTALLVLLLIFYGFFPSALLDALSSHPLTEWALR